MTNKWINTPVIAVAVAVTAGGCNLEPETIQSLTEVVHQVAQVSHQKPGSRASDSPTESVATPFAPAYPDRVDPFTFPAGTVAQQPMPTTITTVAQVRVLGFAEVDQPRALLRIKEKTHSVKIGDVAEGVEIVAIRPPAVQLRMGSIVWTASMFDGSGGK